MKNKILSIMLVIMTLVGITQISYKVEASGTVNSLIITDVAEPLAGMLADFSFCIPENADYEIAFTNDKFFSGDCCGWVVTDKAPSSYEELYETSWYYATDINGIGQLAFESGKYYTFVAWVRCKGASAYSSTVSATINSNPANVKLFDTSDKVGYAEIWYTFYCGDKLCGDVNLDEKISPLDASLVLQYNAGLITELASSEAADVNRDGNISPLDASLILQYNAGLIKGFPNSK